MECKEEVNVLFSAQGREASTEPPVTAAVCPNGQTQADAGLVNLGCTLGQVVQMLGVSYTCQTFGGVLGLGGICCCTGKN